MEGALEGEDAIALRIAVHEVIAARHLDRALVRLEAGIGEEHPVREGGVDEALGQPLTFGDLEQVGGVPELLRLLDQGTDDVRMRMAAGIHRDAGAEIEPSLAASRDEPDAVAFFEGHVGTGVGRQDGGGHGIRPLE